MAKVTCKGLTYAKYSAGGEGTAVTYTGGKAKTDYLCQVDLKDVRTAVDEYADGHKIDREAVMTGVTCDLELAEVDTDIKADLLGYVAGTNSEMSVTDADVPFVGVGFIMSDRFKGTMKYEGYWIYKIQFTSAGISARTREDQTQFQHETLNGEGVGVQLAASGATIFYDYIGGQTTEAAVRTWLNGKAGIT